MTRYCELCGRMIRNVTIKQIQRWQSVGRKIVCKPCLKRRTLGIYDEKLFDSD